MTEREIYPPHPHYYMLGSPNGPNSYGVCLHCGSWGIWPNDIARVRMSSPPTIVDDFEWRIKGAKQELTGVWRI